MQEDNSQQLGFGGPESDVTSVDVYCTSGL
jgi:hypothetical protein